MHINIESKAPWHAVHDDLPQFETRPAELAATLKSLSADLIERPATEMKSGVE